MGSRKRVVCICSAGLMRSPTAAMVIGNTYNCETMFFGTSEIAEGGTMAKNMAEAVLATADEVVCMEQHHADFLREAGVLPEGMPVKVLDIPDEYLKLDPVLVELILERYRP